MNDLQNRDNNKKHKDKVVSVKEKWLAKALPKKGFKIGDFSNSDLSTYRNNNKCLQFIIRIFKGDVEALKELNTNKEKCPDCKWSNPINNKELL